MSAIFVARLIREAKSSSTIGRGGDLDTRCFVVVSRHSGRKAMACVGANRNPEEKPTPQLETLVRVLWPEGFPGDQMFINGGAELVSVLSIRLAELVRAGPPIRCGDRPGSRGRRAEALCF